ncbi:MAG: DNA-binding protein [Solirubrobacterales bacterium]
MVLEDPGAIPGHDTRDVTFMLHSHPREMIPITNASTFWSDLAHDLEDPEFLREYVVESMRIATIDKVVNALDDARESAGLSKAELARAIQVEPATIRRLFASEKSNPTLGTLAEVAAALGMRITLEPLADDERAQVTDPILAGRTADPAGLARHLHDMRTQSRIPA